ncbi:hypothetical protein Sme01_59480 [Sphaerisporangium melleum]|uniref:DUF397 domain-containing protein n=2 Tax=Sphaerisporangium melleum TaxID=321316 RepID=A0A917VK38_9ACTN|nr:DUF397 domain-containing protein [Sphaerisporangium melleum]GGK92886.1 hypothetical protein GCM10007964_39250 [Sphaerisporangium melleum]GII73472.1 hypothetical protein Sme01_59480 [Sphaerisporangium melleum]
MAQPDLTKAAWRKSRRSGDTGGGCVEVAGNVPGVVAVRDSKNPSGPMLVFTPHEWGRFLDGVARGAFDR